MAKSSLGMGVPRFTLENFGSLILIEYVPNFGIQTFNLGSPGQIAEGSLVLKSGYAWEKVICTEDTMGHKQEQTSSDNGDVWSHEVIGFITGDEIAIEAGLLSLEGRSFILRITLPNGTKKIVGSPKESLEFRLRSDSQSTIAGRPGTGISFYGNCTARALFLMP